MLRRNPFYLISPALSVSALGSFTVTGDGPELGAPAQAQNAFVWSQCYVNVGDKRQIAIPTATDQDTCFDDAELCTGSRNGANWNVPAVAVPLDINGNGVCDASAISPTADAAPAPATAPPVHTGRGRAQTPPWAPPPSAETGVIEDEVRSGMQDSGSGSDYSEWYPLCTQQMPQGYRITWHQFHLEGDRSCGSWADCRVTTQRDDQVCYVFRMQGHNEGCLAGIPPMCPGNPNEGRRQSEGVLDYRAERISGP